MKLHRNKPTYFGGILGSALLAAVLVVQAPVFAVNITSDSQPLTAESRKTLNDLTKEADRRITALEKSNTDVEKSTILPADAKKTLTDYNKSVLTSTKDIKSTAEKAKTTDAVKDLTSKINGQYGSFKNANATSNLVVNLDSQGGVQKQIVKTASEVQSVINEAGARATNISGSTAGDKDDKSESLNGVGGSFTIGGDGMSIGGSGGAQWEAGLSGSFNGQSFELANVQEMLDQLLSIAASASAIILAVVTIIESLVTGDFAGAAALFMTILAQLVNVDELQLDSLKGLIDLGSALTGGQTFGGNSGAANGGRILPD